MSARAASGVTRAASGNAYGRHCNTVVIRSPPAPPVPSCRHGLGACACVCAQVPCLDLVQLHWWDYSVPGMTDTARALADCQAKGLIKHVAVTNMDTPALAKIVDAGVDVVANQVWCRSRVISCAALRCAVDACAPAAAARRTHAHARA